jgi:PAS domain S-box-containing protein
VSARPSGQPALPPAPQWRAGLIRWLGDLRQPRLLAIIAVLTAGYAVAGKLGLSLAVVNASASAVWPPTGIALAALLVLGPSVWPGIFLGAFLVNILTTGSILTSIGIAIGNTLEGLTGAHLVNRFSSGRWTFELPQDIWRFVLLAALVSTTISATMGATSLSLSGFSPWPDYGAVWLTWWLGDAVGAVLVTPLLVLWSQDERVRWSRQQRLEAVLILLSIVVVGQVLFGGWLPSRLRNYPLDFLAIPILVWTAFRFGRREAATAMGLLSGIALWGTLRGFGPFLRDTQHESLLLLQAFLGVTAVMTLTFAAVVSESRRGDEARARMATIVESSDDAIVSEDLAGTITSWNPSAEKLFGFTVAEALGRPMAVIIPADRLHEAAEALRRLRQGEVVAHFETIRTRKDGTPVEISLTVSPVRTADGEIVGASNIARDISDRKRIETDRRALLALEQAARAEAEAANRAKDEFLAILSHELRTPLNAVYGWARMLQAGRLTEETAARALDAIVRNANAQVQLIDDLLDVSRVIAGKMRLELGRVDVKAVIEAALDAVRPGAAAKGVGLQGEFDPDAEPITGDAGRLQQVVWNLLTNAVKFTPPGGWVQVRLRRLDAAVEIVVADTGRGIAAQALPFIFERFRQWDSSSTRQHSGLGLGLALVKHLVQLHGGRVTAHSMGEDRGATFTVILPATTAAAHVLGGQPAPVSGQAVRLDRLRVLVVDDDPDALELVAAILTGAGAVVRTCSSASAALAVLREWRPHVLVSDVDMPGEDGYSLIQKVRALDGQQGGRTPAIALTAYGRIEDRVRTLSAGYSMHVPKPIDPGELTAIIASVSRIFASPA